MKTLATLAVILLSGVTACGGDAPPPASPAGPTPAGSITSTPVIAAPPVSAAVMPATPPPAEPASVTVVVSADIKKIVDAADRDAADKKLDAGRKPGEMLAFAGIKPGMKVADIAAAGGYTTELLARAVGPTGKVYGQNSQGMLDKFAAKPWAARTEKPINKNVVSVVREFDDPFPVEATNLDAVVINLFYHDAIWLKVDLAKMNAAIFRALRPGGVFIVIDHSAKAGSGTSEAQTNHRIEEPIVRQQVSAAGFTLAETADFLRNPSDKRDWSTSPGVAGEKRGTSDRFVLKFVKP